MIYWKTLFQHLFKIINQNSPDRFSNSNIGGHHSVRLQGSNRISRTANTELVSAKCLYVLWVVPKCW